MADSTTYISVPLYSYKDGFNATISTSASVFCDAGGAYNMKCMGSWLDIHVGWNIAIGTPLLYGQDDIKFGSNFKYVLATALESIWAQVESTGAILRGNAMSHHSSLLKMATKVNEQKAKGASIDFKGVTGHIKQKIK